MSSVKKCGAISTSAADAVILMRAGIDRRDRGAVAVAEQQAALEADGVEERGRTCRALRRACR